MSRENSVEPMPSGPKFDSLEPRLLLSGFPVISEIVSPHTDVDTAQDVTAEQGIHFPLVGTTCRIEV